jgi:hypothetical protein
VNFGWSFAARPALDNVSFMEASQFACRALDDCFNNYALLRVLQRQGIGEQASGKHQHKSDCHLSSHLSDHLTRAISIYSTSGEAFLAVGAVGEFKTI